MFTSPRRSIEKRVGNSSASKRSGRAATCRKFRISWNACRLDASPAPISPWPTKPPSSTMPPIGRPRRDGGSLCKLASSRLAPAAPLGAISKQGDGAEGLERSYHQPIPASPGGQSDYEPPPRRTLVLEPELGRAICVLIAEGLSLMPSASDRPCRTAARSSGG